MDLSAEVERALIKKFRKSIWYRFVGAVLDYRLISEGDRIAVCLSGGKDSMLMAVCMRHLQRFSKFPFGLEFIVMDPGYRAENRSLILDNAKKLGIPAKVFDADIFRAAERAGGSPCYLCARMRRGHLYKMARGLGCNKIALGHHFDDVIETILMSLLYGAQIRTMMPKLKSTSHPGMELIRPMYHVREADILAWRRCHGLEFIKCACSVSSQSENGECLSKRDEMKALIAHFRKINPYIDMNIFKSVHNVNLDTVIGYTLKDKSHSFLECYDE